MNKILEGKKVAILVDTEYIHEELMAHECFFNEQGAEIDYLSYLHGAKERTLVSDVTEVGQKVHSMVVDKEFDHCNPNDYAIVLVAANYVGCRLREIMPIGNLGSVEELRTPPAVRFFAAAMMNDQIIKGALCHALWLLTPVPELLKGRKVICHTVVLADVHNAGGIFIPDPNKVVTDRDLVTGRSLADVENYQHAILAAYQKIHQGVSQ